MQVTKRSRANARALVLDFTTIIDAINWAHRAEPKDFAVVSFASLLRHQEKTETEFTATLWVPDETHRQTNG